MPELTEIDTPAVNEPKVDQSASSTESDTDEEIPDLEQADIGQGTTTPVFPVPPTADVPGDLVSKAKQSRGEKKARKIMSKLGLKPVRLILQYSEACKLK